MRFIFSEVLPKGRALWFFIVFIQISSAHAVINGNFTEWTAFDGSKPIAVCELDEAFYRQVTSVPDSANGAFVGWIAYSSISGQFTQVRVNRINSAGDTYLKGFNAGTVAQEVDPIDLGYSYTVPSNLVLAADTDGLHVYVAWTGKLTVNFVSADDQSLFVAKYKITGSPGSATGTRVWIKEISAASTAAKERPTLVVAKGDPIIAWTDFRSGTADIYATRLSSTNGSTVWGEIGVTTASGLQDNASMVAGLNGNDLFVGFTDELNNTVKIKAKKIKTDGGTMEGLGGIGGQVLNPQIGSEIGLSPFLVADNAGGFYAVWHQGVHAQTVKIYAAQYGSSINEVRAPTVLGQSYSRYSADLNVASDAAGGLLATWKETELNGAFQIHATRMNSSWNEAWGSGGVTVTANSGSDYASIPSIAPDGSGGAYVAYSREAGSDFARLRVHHIPSDTASSPVDGFPATYAGDVIQGIANDRISSPGVYSIDNRPPSLVHSSNGILASWLGNTGETGNYEGGYSNSSGYVYTQVFSSSVQASRIATPAATSPTGGESITSGTALDLLASNYSATGGTLTHLDSDFVIRDTSDSNVLEQTIDAGIKNMLTVDTGTAGLTAGETYTWTVRYTGSTGEVSAWSAPAAFMVAAPDMEPDAFSFTDQTGVALSTVVTSNSITVSGINAAADISVSGGEYSINGGGFTSASGTVSNADTVVVRHTSSNANSTAVQTTLTIGGVSDTFSSTTLAAEDNSNGSGGGGSLGWPFLSWIALILGLRFGLNCQSDKLRL